MLCKAWTLLLICGLQPSTTLTPNARLNLGEDDALLPPMPIHVSENRNVLGISDFVDIWEIALKNQNFGQQARQQPLGKDFVPKTIIAVSSKRMKDAIPGNAPNPLLDPRNNELAKDFLLDHFSSELLNLQETDFVRTPAVSVLTFTDKSLVFTRCPATGTPLLNGIEIEHYERQNDGTSTIIIKDFLFNHKDLLKAALQPYLPRTTTSLPTGLQSGEKSVLVPKLPASLKAADPQVDYSAFVNVWDNRVWQRERISPTSPREQALMKTPRTVLAVTPYKFVNLVPADAPNPLYSTEYDTLTDEFILDQISENTINLNDPGLTFLLGVTIKSMSGKDWTFKKDMATGKIFVNGIEIEKQKLLEDNTNVIIIKDFMFIHHEKVQNAFRDLLKTSSSPFKVSVVHSKTEKDNIVPNLPTALKIPDPQIDFSGLVNVWNNRITQRDRLTPLTTRQEATLKRPKTVVAVTNLRVTSVVPRGATNPLYSTEYNTLTDQFILDHISEDTINLNDPALTLLQGVTIKTISGRDMVFKKNTKGDITINGVPVQKQKLLSDNTNVILIEDFLFNYEDVIKNAYNALIRSTKKTTGSPEHSQSVIYEQVIVPRLPNSLKTPDSQIDFSGMVDVWNNRIFQRDRVSPPSFQEESRMKTPRTVLAVNPYKFVNLVPADAPNPLYSSEYDTLTDEFILDQISENTINLNDPALTSLLGVTIKSMSGKDWIFKKDIATGNIFLNGIEIEKQKLLEDNTNVILIKDFMFNHHEKVQNAFRNLLKSSPSPLIVSVVQSKTENGNIVPNLPTALKIPDPEIDFSGLVNVWNNRITQRDRLTPLTPSQEATLKRPKTVVAVTNRRMTSVVPRGAINPLYSTEYNTLTDQFILDHISEDTINLNDPALTLPQGVTIKSISGRDLVFNKNGRGKISVNGVEVKKQKLMADNTNVIIIKDFLFNHRNKIQNAVNTLRRSK